MYYLLIIAVIIVGFSAVLYQVASNDLSFGLRRQTQRLTEDFPVFSGSPYLQAGHELDEGQHHLFARLALCDALVLIGAGFASYALARRTLEPIETAHEQQKRFTADVSHELRTPLTALKMESEVALLDPRASAADLRGTLASNVEEAEKLTLLVSNLLRLTQLDSAPIEQSPIALNTLVKAAIRGLTPIAEQRNITITTKLGHESTVYGEPSTLTQLFAILLDNAIKYSPNNTTITVQARHQQQSVDVRITDQGSGIAKTDLDHVFERFYRADSSRTSNKQASGFGIGLSLAKLIADSLGATISLTSKLGHGTTATVTMPLVVDQSPKTTTK